MKIGSMTCLLLKHLFLLSVIAKRCLVMSCSFPDALQLDLRDPPWYSHVRTDGSRDVEYYIRHNVMEIHYPKSDRSNVRWKCTTIFHDKLLLKRQDHLVHDYYRCARFLFRSRSVVQIMWSHEVRNFDLSLCDDLNMKTDPWPLIWYGTLEADYTPCPFSGGFDMKIIDSIQGENGCNLMLRPMRMEVECLGGEGVTFNFMSSNCLPAIKMFVKQRTICVTSWQDSKNHYVILRRNEDIDLWCLVMPIYRTSNTTAYLFSDLACTTDTVQLASIKNVNYFTLYLTTRVFSSLCQDEYEQCSKVTCNAYVKQECQKSCAVCDASSIPTQCEFPSDFIGSWILKDVNGSSQTDIASSSITITGVGDFICVSYPNTKPKTSFYTTISMYQNGCRPRFTCLYIRRIGPSVLQYSLSQSYVWPTQENDLGNAICGEERFHPDPSPIDDKYRPHEGAGKPIIAHMTKSESVHCNITNVYTISGTLPKGYKCSGTMYPHCEDFHKIRLDFPSCGSLIPELTDYRCLANFEGHYWERILLVQNIQNEKDVVCFVFSQYYPNEAYVLVASECDQKSFSFARSGLRQPMLTLEIHLEGDSCKSIPMSTSTVKPTESLPTESRYESSVREADHNSNIVTNITVLETDYYSPVSMVDTGPASGNAGKVSHKATYVDTRRAVDTAGAKSTSYSDENSLTADYNVAATVTSSGVFSFVVLVLATSLL
ncbi:unnamed protein product [Candidula unifasciata]|uniref:DUF7043 domain-containing protein n=1 Tax=Candidula unifasciata TaxID=100452 RepID=A0A8S3ZHB6_9EUPU|nr:unnamed protein product [Candidula unifasciata]